MILLIASVVKTVKSGTTPRHSFLQQELLGLHGSHGFFSDSGGVFDGAVLPGSHDVLYIGVLFPSTDSSFHMVPCVLNFKGPYL